MSTSSFTYSHGSRNDPVQSVSFAGQAKRHRKSALSGNDIYLMPTVHAAALTLAMHEHTRIKADIISVSTEYIDFFKYHNFHTQRECTQVENVFKTTKKNNE